jgi:hypothetical protein
MLRTDYTVPTRCRHRGGIVDPAGYAACRALRQPISPSNQILDHSIQNHPKPVSFQSSGVSSGSSLTALNPTITHTKSPTSGVNRIASQICHNRLFRRKLQQNILPMISTEVSSLAADNIWRTRPLGARPCCFAWEGRRRSEGGHLAFLAHENVATLAFFTNEERSESQD